jgi:imidazolonepropionase-like amidohydrolase
LSRRRPLTRLTPALALSSAAIALSCATTPRASVAGPRADVALRVARILDPHTGGYSAARVILVRDGSIADVVAPGEFAAGMADTTIDLGELTVLPGLVDAHVHLVIGGPVRDNALAILRAGFTTVLDLGARSLRILALRDSINSGAIVGPRVRAAGMWIGTQGGICEFGGIGVAGGPDAFRARVREQVAGGADVIKLCVSGWPADAFARPTEKEMADEVLDASVREAHDAGRLVIGHDISLGGVRAGLRAGLDGLAHAAYVDSAAARQMAARGVFMIPTLASLIGSDASAQSRALVASVALARGSGVPLVFGTDGGVLPHGRNAEEFSWLLSAGVSPIDAIRMATVNAARVLRLADSIGVVRPGMAADIIGVSGDPLSDLDILRRPAFVMSRGRVIK